MRLATLSAAAVLAALATPVLAADMATGMQVPPPSAGINYDACPPPAVHVKSRTPVRDLTSRLFRRRGAWVQPPDVRTVEAFEGVNHGPPIHVQGQTAYLASSSCPPSIGHSAGGSWYDGKTFYYEGTTPHRADTFMVIVEPSRAHEPILRRFFMRNR